MFRAANRSKRGFTLVELMAVVVIVGILSTLAVYGVRKYVFSTKTTEAIHMIGSIKSAEESYKSETFKYLGASSGIDSSDHYYPRHKDPKTQSKADWTNTDHGDYSSVWGPLGVTSDSPVIFEYVIVAGAPGGAFPTISDFPNINWGPQGASAPGPWYVVAARADQNGDGTMSCFVSSNLTGEIFSIRDDE